MLVVLELLAFTLAPYEWDFARLLQGESVTLSRYTLPAVRNEPEFLPDWNPFLGNSSKSGTPIKAEQLILYVNGTQISATYLITISKDNSLFDVLARRLGFFDPDTIVRILLGEIKVNGSALHFAARSPEFNENSPDAQLILDAYPVLYSPFAELSIGSLSGAKDFAASNNEIVINVKDADVPLSDLPQISSSQEHKRYLRAHDTYNKAVRFEIVSKAVATGEPIADFFRKVGVSDWPIVEQLVLGFFDSLPFLIFLFVSYQKSLDSSVALRRYRRMVWIFLVLEFGYYFLSASTVILGSVERSVPHLARRLPLFSFTGFPGDMNAPTLLLLVLVGLVWPIVVGRELKRTDSSSGHAWYRWIPGLIAVSIILTILCASSIYQILAVLHTPRNSITMIQASETYAAVIATLIFGLLLWTLFELLDWVSAVRIAPLLFVALILGTVVGGVPRIEGSALRYRVFTAVTQWGLLCIPGAFLILALVRLLYGFLAKQGQYARLPRNWSVAVWVCGFLASLPVRWPPMHYEVTFHELWRLTYEVKGIFIFGFLWLLICLLHESSGATKWPGLSRASQDIGIVLAVGFFFSTKSFTFSIPVSMSIGALLVYFFLFREPRAKQAAVEISNARSKIVTELLDLKHTQRDFAAVQKGLLNRLEKGKGEYDEYQKKVSALAAIVKEKRSSLLHGGQPTGVAVLAFGPRSSHWENGKSAARFGLLFGIPWILLSLRDLFVKPMASDYVILRVLVYAIALTLQWPLYGFFFGYFYGYIRGENGIQKALSYVLVLVVPSVIITALYSAGDKASWLGLTFWVLQVFIQCMLLGLIAGDLVTLRNAGSGFKELLEIHNWGALAAWTSSVAIALGAAAATLLTQGATELVSVLLKYVGVNLPSKTP